MKNLWNDEAGFIISAELVLIATILVIGMIAGLASARDAAITELADLGGAIGSANQSFVFGGAVGHNSNTAGSGFADLLDFCDTTSDTSNGGNSRCLSIGTTGTAEGAAS